MSLVVAHFKTGKVIKGTAISFNPKESFFYLSSESEPYGSADRIDYKELKAAFFVKSFGGRPEYKPKKQCLQSTGYGQKVQVKFSDSEEIVGYAHQMDFGDFGFFLIPGDPKTNNDRIFIVYSALLSILDLESGKTIWSPPESPKKPKE